MSITTQCMILNLRIGLWTGQRLDKQASARVTANASAAGDAASVNKHTVPKQALAPITAAASALRTHFYTHTLPWKDNGDRVLSRVRYQEFMQEHATLEAAFHQAVRMFCDVHYPSAIEQASFRMGDMFQADDYPSADALRSKFYVELDIDAITDAGDFRVEMDDDALDAVRAQMTQALAQRLERAMQDVWQRLATTLTHFAEKMQGDEVFRDSTVTNVEAIVAALPELNITNDPNLERVRQELVAVLAIVDPDTLRKHKDVRSAVSVDTQRIIDDMAGFMNAFGATS